MTTATARTVANVVLASAGLAAAYVILTTPPLRRLALGGLKLWLGICSPRCTARGWSRRRLPDIMAP
jgi:hypothetical protein